MLDLEKPTENGNNGDIGAESNIEITNLNVINEFNVSNGENFEYIKKVLDEYESSKKLLQEQVHNLILENENLKQELKSSNNLLTYWKEEYEICSSSFDLVNKELEQLKIHDDSVNTFNKRLKSIECSKCGHEWKNINIENDDILNNEKELGNYIDITNILVSSLFICNTEKDNKGYMKNDSDLKNKLCEKDREIERLKKENSEYLILLNNKDELLDVLKDEICKLRSEMVVNENIPKNIINIVNTNDNREISPYIDEDDQFEEEITANNNRKRKMEFVSNFGDYNESANNDRIEIMQKEIRLVKNEECRENRIESGQSHCDHSFIINESYGIDNNSYLNDNIDATGIFDLKDEQSFMLIKEDDDSEHEFTSGDKNKRSNEKDIENTNLKMNDEVINKELKYENDWGEDDLQEVLKGSEWVTERVEKNNKYEELFQSLVKGSDRIIGSTNTNKCSESSSSDNNVKAITSLLDDFVSHISSSLGEENRQGSNSNSDFNDNTGNIRSLFDSINEKSYVNHGEFIEDNKVKKPSGFTGLVSNIRNFFNEDLTPWKYSNDKHDNSVNLDVDNSISIGVSSLKAKSSLDSEEMDNTGNNPMIEEGVENEYDNMDWNDDEWINGKSEVFENIAEYSSMLDVSRDTHSSDVNFRNEETELYSNKKDFGDTKYSNVTEEIESISYNVLDKKENSNEKVATSVFNDINILSDKNNYEDSVGVDSSEDEWKLDDWVHEFDEIGQEENNECDHTNENELKTQSGKQDSGESNSFINENESIQEHGKIDNKEQAIDSELGFVSRKDEIIDSIVKFDPEVDSLRDDDESRKINIDMSSKSDLVVESEHECFISDTVISEFVTESESDKDSENDSVKGGFDADFSTEKHNDHNLARKEERGMGDEFLKLDFEDIGCNEVDSRFEMKSKLGGDVESGNSESESVDNIVNKEIKSGFGENIKDGKSESDSEKKLYFKNSIVCNRTESDLSGDDGSERKSEDIIDEEIKPDFGEYIKHNNSGSDLEEKSVLRDEMKYNGSETDSEASSDFWENVECGKTKSELEIKPDFEKKVVSNNEAELYHDEKDGKYTNSNEAEKYLGTKLNEDKTNDNNSSARRKFEVNSIGTDREYPDNCIQGTELECGLKEFNGEIVDNDATKGMSLAESYINSSKDNDSLESLLGDDWGGDFSSWDENIKDEEAEEGAGGNKRGKNQCFDHGSVLKGELSEGENGELWEGEWDDDSHNDNFGDSEWNAADSNINVVSDVSHVGLNDNIHNSNDIEIDDANSSYEKELVINWDDEWSIDQDELNNKYDEANDNCKEKFKEKKSDNNDDSLNKPCYTNKNINSNINNSTSIDGWDNENDWNFDDLNNERDEHVNMNSIDETSKADGVDDLKWGDIEWNSDDDF